MIPRYHRDVWALFPAQTGYPGAFPRGLINRIKKMGWWGEKRLWVFSGGFKDSQGTTVDIKSELGPDIVANAESLPLPDESYDFVMLDPPYSKEESERMYNLPYCNIVKVLNEAARVCKTGGVLLLMHRLVPWRFPAENPHKLRMRMIAVVGVCMCSGYSNMRALCVWRKEPSLIEYQKEGKNVETAV